MHLFPLVSVAHEFAKSLFEPGDSSSVLKFTDIKAKRVSLIVI